MAIRVASWRTLRFQGKPWGQGLLVAISLSVWLLPYAPDAHVQAAPPVKKFVLDSGHEVYIQENHARPIVTLDTWVNTGSVHEEKYNNGVSHFLEHLLFKGTQTYKVGEFERLLESKGAQFNAATSQDYTHYYITIASQFFEEALDLHADMLMNATIPEAELTRERKVVQEEINRALDSPQRKLFIAMDELLFPNHGYGLDTLGPKETIGSIPRQDILNYYHHWYQPKHLRTVIVGDVETKKALAMVKAAFSEAAFLAPDKATYQPPKTGPAEKMTAHQIEVLSDSKASQAYTVLAFPGPSIENRQDTYALDVAMQALGQGRSSTLYRKLREEQQLVESISGGNFTQKHAGIVYVMYQSTPENLEPATQSVMEALIQATKNGITTEQLNKVKTQFIKEFIFHNETTDGVANALGYNVTIGTLDDYTDYVDNIQKVSLEDVHHALQKYVQLDRTTLVTLLPEQTQTEEPPTGKETADAPSASPLAENNPKVPSRTEMTERLQATLAYGIQSQKTQHVVETVTQEEASSDEPQQTAIQKIQLDNGMTVVLKPWENAETVTMKLVVKGGQLVEPLPGVSSLVSRLLLQGTENRSAKAIHHELEKLGLKLSFSPNADYIEVTAGSVTEDFGELLLILQDILTQPAFLPEELDKEKKLLQQSLASSRDNPTNVAFENLTLELYPDHPYGNVGKRIEEHLPAITREHLQTYFQQWFVPKNIVVSVVGDFDADLVLHFLNSTFPPSRNELAAKEAPLAEASTVPKLKQAQVVNDGKAEQAATWIGQGWLVPGISNIQDYVPLKVLNTYLGSGMSSRLFVNLREKQGLAYAVGSSYPSRQGQSYFVMYIGTDPKNEEKVLQGFEKEIQRLSQVRLTATELAEAKDKFVGAFDLAHETTDQQAFYLGFYETMGAGYEFDREYPHKIRSVTAEDIQRIAKTYFARPNILSIVSPEGAKLNKGKESDKGK